MLVVVTFAPRLEVSETNKVVSPVAAPSRSRLALMINALLPPARVDVKFTVDAVRVREPDKVIGA